MHRSTRNTSGQSSVELVCALSVIVLIVLFGIDVATIVIGSQFNTNMCRNAARAAANGAPNTLSRGAPLQRAIQAIQLQSGESLMRVRSGQGDVVVTENQVVVPPPPLGGAISGSVSVETTADVYPPFLLARILGKKSMPVTARITMPFTYIVSYRKQP